MPGEPPARGPTDRHTVGGVDTAVLDRDVVTVADLLAELDLPQPPAATVVADAADEAMRAVACAATDGVAARYSGELLAEAAGVLRWLRVRGWLGRDDDVEQLANLLLGESAALTARADACR